jgi:hypothetical protein
MKKNIFKTIIGVLILVLLTSTTVFADSIKWIPQNAKHGLVATSVNLNNTNKKVIIDGFIFNEDVKNYYIMYADIVFVFTDKNNPKNILKCTVSCRNGKDMDKKKIKALKGNKNNQEKNSRFRLETTNFKVISGKWPGKDVKLD